MRIFLSRPHMGGAELQHISEAFASGFVAPLGSKLDEFEQLVSDYLGGGFHCVGLSSGSAALHLALRIVGVTETTQVWVSSMTFAGGVFPVLYQGATPVFFDLSPDSWTIDCDLLEDALIKANRTNSLPRAIVPTDLYGQSVDLERLEILCTRYGVSLVVDSAESLGASGAFGRKCGTGGDAAILSFNGNKIITTSGGGMMVTKSADMAAEARFLATQARDPAPHYEHSTFGYNYRMSNICAAIGVGQMDVLNARVVRRREICRRYQAALSRYGVTFMPEPEGYFSSKWLTVARFDPDILGVNREEIRLKLAKHKIESRPMWKPMQLQPLFASAAYHGTGFDEELFAEGLCLPSGSDMSNSDQDDVIEHIIALLNAGNP
jgi:pyridoxal phosphate-dependent aminotransferase EpsN